MSSTTSDFESTPIVVANRPTTYGELREHAQSTIERTSKESIALAVLVDEDLVPGAVRGAMRVILTLLDELERLAQEDE